MHAKIKEHHPNIIRSKKKKTGLEDIHLLVHLVKCLPLKHEDLRVGPRTDMKMSCILVDVCCPSAGVAERESKEFSDLPVWPTW